MKISNYQSSSRLLPVATRRSQFGFTLIELIAVIVLLGVLAATAIPRFLNVTDDAQRASLEGSAGGFSTAVAIAKAQWQAEGYTKGGPTTPANKIAINLDGTIIYMNEYGLPANTDPGLDAGSDNQSATECQQVLDAILQNSPPSTTVVSERGRSRYFVSAISGAGGDDIGNVGDVCRYELITQSSTPTHFFDYDLVDGRVTTVTP